MGLDQYLGGRIKNYSDTPIRIKPDKSFSSVHLPAHNLSHKIWGCSEDGMQQILIIPCVFAQQHKLQGNKGHAELIELIQR